MATGDAAVAALLIFVLNIILAEPSDAVFTNVTGWHYPNQDPGSIEQRYENWLDRYGRKNRTEAERRYRFSVYRKNVRFIDNINSLNLPFKLTDNKFAEMTNREFRETHLGLRCRPRSHGRYLTNHGENETNFEGYASLPLSVDWRRRGAVTPVKDQGNCGTQPN